MEKNIRTVNEHIGNIFKEEELDESSVIRNFRITAADGKNYDTAHYNLDVIISIGYRVKSRQGTQFRIWANRVLKDYLVQGYALNQQRLEAQQEKLAELRQAIALSSRLVHNKSLSASESQGILAILEKYSYALTVLDDYDHQRLRVTGTHAATQPKITYDEAMKRMIPSKARWRRSTRLSTARSFTQVLRRRPPTCCISSSRTTHSPTATSELPPRFFSGFWSGRASCTTPKETSVSPTMRWLRLPC